MAQVGTSNYPIPNDTGANFRADVNENLADLYSTSSGSSAPPAAVSGQLWLDTSTNPDTLKIKTASGWVSLGTITTNFGMAPLSSPTFTGNVNVPPGTSTNPGIRLASSGNSGIFWGSVNDIRIRAGGSESMGFYDDYINASDPIRLPSGSVNIPSLHFAADTDTGIYQGVAGAISFSAQGALRAYVNSYGLNTFNGLGLRLWDTTSNYVELKSASNVTTSYTLRFPPTVGSANQFLKLSNTSGVLEWSTGSSGTGGIYTHFRQLQRGGASSPGATQVSGSSYYAYNLTGPNHLTGDDTTGSDADVYSSDCLIGHDGLNGAGSNRIRLAAGAYYIEWGMVFAKCGAVVTRIFDYTGNQVLQIGLVNELDTDANTNVWCEGKGYIKLSTASDIGLQYRAEYAVTNGLGLGNTLDTSHQWAYFNLWKLSYTTHA